MKHYFNLEEMHPTTLAKLKDTIKSYGSLYVLMACIDVEQETEQEWRKGSNWENASKSRTAQGILIRALDDIRESI